MDKLESMLNKVLKLIDDDPQAVFDEISSIHDSFDAEDVIPIEEYLDRLPQVYESIFAFDILDDTELVEIEEKPFFGEMKFIENLKQGNFTPILSAA